MPDPLNATAPSRQAVREIVAETYLLHERGGTVNPDSHFLRFPEKPSSRVIALPAYVGGAVDTVGIKWISSFPNNITAGIPRASAVLILNDYTTGHPLALLEAAGISAARTAASAAVSVSALAEKTASHRLGVVGAGVIARTVLNHLADADVLLARVCCHDLDRASAERLAGHARDVLGLRAAVAYGLHEALDCDLILFVTTAATPYVPADVPLRPGQLLINLSLRDLAPELLLKSFNIVDDVDHCLKADTSPHLAEQLSGSRDFVGGTIGGVLAGTVQIDRERPIIVSPFGLGALDVAVGRYVLDRARERGLAVAIDDFFGETRRW